MTITTNQHYSLLALFAFYCLAPLSSLAQSDLSTPPTFLRCGTDHVSTDQQKSLTNCTYSSDAYGCADGGRSCVIEDFVCGKIRIPIVFTVITDGNGNGGVSDATIAVHIADANSILAAAQMELYQYLPPRRGNEFDSADFYDFDDDGGACTGDGDEEEISVYDIPNVINVYLPNVVKRCGDGFNGYANFPSGSARTIIKSAVIGTQYTTFIHELGHIFGLYHTHSTFEGAEKPDGSNCCQTGDKICDTPADPSLSGVIDNFPNCNYIGDPAYAPLTDNIMSYSYSFCRNKFTDCQIAKFYHTLLECRTELCMTPEAPAVVQPDTITYGDVLPILTASIQANPNRSNTNGCVEWAIIEGGNVITLAQAQADFTPTYGTGIGEINGAGDYQFMVRDIHPINQTCQSEWGDPIVLTVLPDCAIMDVQVSSNCINTNAFEVFLTFSGSGTNYTVSDGNTELTDVPPDTYTFGPYNNGEQVTMTVADEECSMMEETISQNCTELYCNSSGDASAEWITKVDFVGTNQVSGSDGGYGDYTNIIFSVQTQKTFPIILTPDFANTANPVYWQVWIDDNQNFIFETEELVFQSINPTSQPLTTPITINKTGVDRLTQMRIMMSRDAPITDPCMASGFNGEVEDYSVFIETPCTIVTNTNDSGFGSLRHALDCAGDGDTIRFDFLTGAPPFIIQPIIPFPIKIVVGQLVIEAQNYPLGAVILDGSLSQNGVASGLNLSGGEVIIHGLYIRNFTGNGIQDFDAVGRWYSHNIIANNGFFAILGGGNQKIIENNYFGVNPNEGISLPNSSGDLSLFDGSDIQIRNNICLGRVTLSTSEGQIVGNTIGFNPFTEQPTTGHLALNSGSRITVGGVAPEDRNIINNISLSQVEDATIAGNHIGVEETGALAIGRLNFDGLYLVDCKRINIGMTTPNGGNVVSGHTTTGIHLSGSEDISIQNNKVGTDLTGTLPIPNGYSGILTRNASKRITIGGKGAMEGNIISGNAQNGIYLLNSTDSVWIQGNNIGTDITGTKSLSNGGDGVDIRGGSVWIGGAETGAGNIISANLDNGIYISTTNSDVLDIQGNTIGTDALGSINLANNKSGIYVNEGNGIQIGGREGNPFLPNQIAYNGREGIYLGTVVDSCQMQGNGFYCNEGGGITLDGFANRFVSIPSIFIAHTDNISGTAGDSAYVELYRVSGDCSEFCHGEQYLGSTGTDSNRRWSFTDVAGLGLEIGDEVVAIATDTINQRTSIFSNCAIIGLPPAVLQFKTILGGAYDLTTQEMYSPLPTPNTFQPYRSFPWRELHPLIFSDFPEDVIDWVLIEVQDLNYNRMTSRLGFVRPDGTIVDLFGNENFVFTSLSSIINYHIIIRHYNHLDVMSAAPINISEAALYDFTNPDVVAGGVSQLQLLAPGVYGMAAGDFNTDGMINTKDFNDYRLNEGESGYYIQDLNLDGNVSIQDFELYQSNAGKIGVAPIRY